MIVVNVKDKDFDVWGARWGKYPGLKHLNNTDYPNKGWLGNPYNIGYDGDRPTVIAKFKVDFDKKIATDETFKQAVFALKGQKVCCFCKPENCHLDIVKDYLEKNHGS